MQHDGTTLYWITQTKDPLPGSCLIEEGSVQQVTTLPFSQKKNRFLSFFFETAVPLNY